MQAVETQSIRVRAWSVAAMATAGIGLPALRDLWVRAAPSHRFLLSLSTTVAVLGLISITVPFLRLTRAQVGLSRLRAAPLLLGIGAGVLLAAPFLAVSPALRTPSAWAVSWILLAVGVEELFFRGLLFAVIQRAWGGAPAVAGSGAAFALAHSAAYPGRALVVVAVAGVYLGVLRALAGNLWAPASAHTVLDLFTAAA